MVTLLAFIFVLGLLIFVHELGHFLVAKWAGVRVEVFSLGFGPRLVSFVRGDTEYCVCAVPLGGYVKMTGQEDLPGEADSRLTGADYEFPSKPWWQRLLIAVAGPAMNFIAAFVLFFGVYFFIGIPSQVEPGAIAQQVVPGYPAAGVLEPGDRIMSVNGTSVQLFRDLNGAINKSPTDDLELEIERDGKPMTVTVHARTEVHPAIRTLFSEPLVQLFGKGAPIGLAFFDAVCREVYPVVIKSRPATKPSEQADQPDQPVQGLCQRRIGIVAERAIIGEVHRDQQLPPETRHLRSGDVVLAVNGHPIQVFEEFNSFIRQNAKTPIRLRLQRPEPFDVELLTSSHEGQDVAAYGAQVGEGGRIESVIPGSKADEAGLHPGDVVLSQKARPIPFFKKLFRKIRGEDVSENLIVSVKREGPWDLVVTPVESPLNRQGLLGVEKATQLQFRQFDPVDSLRAATLRFVDSSLVVFVILEKLFTANLPASTLAGPVGIMQVTGKQAERGLMELLILAGILSVNLAIVNLLPIPILDGSHIVLCLVEGVRRKPVDAKVQAILQYVGILILLPFILYVTLHDIIRWIRDIIG